MPARARPYLAPALAVLLVGLVEFALLWLWQGNSYWGFSSGVYAQSAREFLHGLTPYRDFAAAQPPPVFLAGALMLAISDTAAAVHAGLALVQLVTAGLVALSVWRLEGNRWLAVGAGLVTPLLPIALNSHAQLVPEMLAAPLILGGALACADDSRQDLGAVLLALAAWCKVAFVIPALAVALFAPRRGRALVVTAGATLGLYAVSVAAFGLGVWREVFLAQFQVGEAGLRYAGGLIAQIAWNELPLVAAAVLLLVPAVRRQRRDDRLLVTLAAAALAGLVLALTVFKKGSYLNVMVVAEPPLLVLAACGSARGWRTSTGARALVMLAGALLAGQSISLLASPGDPGLAVRPLARSGLAWQAGRSEVDREVDSARQCPPGTVYPGNPYIAFLADRPMPGDQPDLFILANAHENARFAAKVSQDRRPRCPG